MVQCEDGKDEEVPINKTHSCNSTTSNSTIAEVFPIMVQCEDVTDEEALINSNKRAEFKDDVSKAGSTMTLLTMDKSKSFYNKEYYKEHIGESREVSTYIHNRYILFSYLFNLFR